MAIDYHEDCTILHLSHKVYYYCPDTLDIPIQRWDETDLIVLFDLNPSKTTQSRNKIDLHRPTFKMLINFDFINLSKQINIIEVSIINVNDILVQSTIGGEQKDKELFLTYLGMLRYLFVSRNPSAKSPFRPVRKSYRQFI
jgi:hypothetical protein